MHKQAYKLFNVFLNGCPYGTYPGKDEVEAVTAMVRDAGYKTIGEAEAVLGEALEATVEEVAE